MSTLASVKPDGPRNVNWRPWIELRVVNCRYKVTRLVQKVGDKHIIFYFPPSIVDACIPGCKSTHEDVIELVGRAFAQVLAA